MTLAEVAYECEQIVQASQELDHAYVHNLLVDKLSPHGYTYGQLMEYWDSNTTTFTVNGHEYSAIYLGMADTDFGPETRVRFMHKGKEVSVRQEPASVETIIDWFKSDVAERNLDTLTMQYIYE